MGGRYEEDRGPVEPEEDISIKKVIFVHSFIYFKYDFFYPWQKFMENFGYLPSFDSDDGIAALMSDDAVREAIKNVQKFGQLTQVRKKE